MIALHGSNGNEIWQLDLKADFGVDTFDIDHAPVIGDFDGDGKLDGFVVGGHTRYPNITDDYGRALLFYFLTSRMIKIYPPNFTSFHDPYP